MRLGPETTPAPTSKQRQGAEDEEDAEDEGEEEEEENRAEEESEDEEDEEDEEDDDTAWLLDLLRHAGQEERKETLEKAVCTFEVLHWHVNVGSF